MRDTVDILLIDDRETDGRGGSTDKPSTIASGVKCRVHDLGPNVAMAFSHEMLKVTHKVHFLTFVKLDPTHRLVWIDPDDGATRTLKVQGTKRPKATSMPYIVFAEEVVT